MFHVLPMGQRVLDKLTRLIDREMKLIGAEKMSLPYLSNVKLWEKSSSYPLNSENRTVITVTSSVAIYSVLN